MEDVKELNSNKLGTMPIFKLILAMSGPSILSMLVQALYNIVDSIFMGMYDPTNGVLALSYAMPMQLLITAFGVGMSVGTGSHISRLLGAGRKDDASNASQTGILLALIISILFAIVGYFVSDTFIKAYTSSAAGSNDAANWDQVYEMGSVYLTICMCCSFGFMIETMLNRILQSMGNMIIPMITQIVGAVTNIVLDPILIIVCKLGSTGAAIATITGQIVAMFIPIIVILHDKRKWDIDIFFKKGFKVRKEILKPILQVGIPTIIMNSVSSITYMASNSIINPYKNAVWAYGIYFKLNSFAFMPVFGLNQGCVPIMAYNYGANKKDRFTKAIKIAMVMAFTYMTLVLALFHLIPDVFLKLFSPDTEEKLEIGRETLRLCTIAFAPASIGIVMIAVFNSLGKGVKAMMISVLRQIVILLPLGIVLLRYTPLGLTGFWTAYPVADLGADLIFLPIMFYTIRKAFRTNDALMVESKASTIEETSN